MANLRNLINESVLSLELAKLSFQLPPFGDDDTVDAVRKISRHRSKLILKNRTGFH